VEAPSAAGFEPTASEARKIAPQASFVASEARMIAPQGKFLGKSPIENGSQ